MNDLILDRNAEDQAALAQEAELDRKVKIKREVEEELSLRDINKQIKRTIETKESARTTIDKCNAELERLRALKEEIKTSLNQ